jgi:hypothetical protein
MRHHDIYGISLLPGRMADASSRTLAGRQRPWDRSARQEDKDEPMTATKKKAATPGRKPPAGEKKQFLTSMDPDIIRRVKAAAAMEDLNASQILEMAAKEWLDRHQIGKK